MVTCWAITTCGPSGFFTNILQRTYDSVRGGGDQRVGHHRVDDRLVGWQDVMPTLLDLAGVPIPETVEGLSMVGERKGDRFYGEIDEGADATVGMIHDGHYKLIYYAAGNHRQLF